MNWRWLLLVTLVLVACGGGGQALPPEQVAQRAADATQALTAVHFTINVVGQGSALGLQAAEGDIVPPDKSRARLKTSTLGLISEVGVVTIAEQQWMTNPLNNQWQAPTAISFNLAALFDPTVGIPGLLRTESWRAGAPETGVAVLEGTVDGAKLNALTGGQITKGSVGVTLRIDSTSFVVNRITLIQTETSPTTPNTWNIILTKPNTPVEIKPPV